MQAVEMVREQGFDFLLAVGGGSVIDATKFIAAAVPFDARDILLKFGGNITRTLPFGVVLTLPATGSEMNHGAVITRHALGAKLPFRSRHVYPRFAILDPTKTYTPNNWYTAGHGDRCVRTRWSVPDLPGRAPVWNVLQACEPSSRSVHAC